MRHSNYPPDWQKRRRTVFERDDFSCQICAFTSPPGEETNKPLHAHHQTKISDGGGHGLDNLVTLCEDCHIEIHSNKGIDEVDRSRFHECAYDGCDEVRGEHALHNGGYCNAQCEYRDKAETALAVLRDDDTFCLTCFSNWPPSEEVCPNCGNWAPDEAGAFQDMDLDLVNFAAHVIWRADHDDLRRD